MYIPICSEYWHFCVISGSTFYVLTICAFFENIDCLSVCAFLRHIYMYFLLIYSLHMYMYIFYSITYAADMGISATYGDVHFYHIILCTTYGLHHGFFAYQYLLNMYLSVCTYVLCFDEIEIWTYPVHTV